MAETTATTQARSRALGSTVAIATASVFIALAAALSFASDGSDGARSLHLRGSLAAGDGGAAPLPLPAQGKHA